MRRVSKDNVTEESIQQALRELAELDQGCESIGVTDEEHEERFSSFSNNSEKKLTITSKNLDKYLNKDLIFDGDIIIAVDKWNYRNKLSNKLRNGFDDKAYFGNIVCDELYYSIGRYNSSALDAIVAKDINVKRITGCGVIYTNNITANYVDADKITADKLDCMFYYIKEKHIEEISGIDANTFAMFITGVIFSIIFIIIGFGSGIPEQMLYFGVIGSFLGGAGVMWVGLNDYKY